MSCDRSIDAGAYALRALEDDEHRAYALHLADCSACRHEVEDLQSVVDTLPMTAPQVPVPAALKSRIMHVVEAEAELLRAAGATADLPPAPAPEPRRRFRFGLGALTLRPGMALACSAFLLAVGGGAGLALNGGGDDTPATRTLAATAPGTAKASLTVTDGRATLHTVGLPAAPKGMVYQVWLKRGNAAPVPTHTLFSVRNDGRSSVAIEESVKGYDRVLVTAEPSGGSTQPTTFPVIGATLS